MPDVYAKHIDSSPEIRLSYVYRGKCENCSFEVETLEQDLTIDSKNHHFVIAFCVNCKAQLQTKEVAKLSSEQ